MRKFLSVSLSAALLTVSIAAQSQPYPVKPIRVIMTVGQGADLLARLIGQRVGDALGQPFVTEIQSAAGGAIGAEMVARAAPDGHTLLLTTAGTQINRVYLTKVLTFDPVKDFTPIVVAADTITAVAAHPSLPANSMRELIEYAKRNPGKIAYASSGVGTTGHLSMELIKILSGADLLHVPYKSGSQTVGDLVGGQILVSVISLSPLISQVRAGKIKLIGMNTSRRFGVFPDVPTVGEQVPGYEPPPAWSGYLGPAGMPMPIVRRLNEEMNKAMASAEVRSRLEAIGFVIVPPNTPEQFAAAIKRELQSVGKIVKAAGIRPE